MPTGDPVETALRQSPLTPAQRADLWDAYQAAPDEDALAAKLKDMGIPKQVKAQLWDLKHATAGQGAPEQPPPLKPKNYVPGIMLKFPPPGVEPETTADALAQTLPTMLGLLTPMTAGVPGALGAAGRALASPGFNAAVGGALGYHHGGVPGAVEGAALGGLFGPRTLGRTLGRFPRLFGVLRAANAGEAEAVSTAGMSTTAEAAPAVAKELSVTKDFASKLLTFPERVSSTTGTAATATLPATATAGSTEAAAVGSPSFREATGRLAEMLGQTPAPVGTHPYPQFTSEELSLVSRLRDLAGTSASNKLQVTEVAKKVFPDNWREVMTMIMRPNTRL